MSHFLTSETGTIRKKWKNRLPVALIYPNTYPVAASSLGFQIIYGLLNRLDEIVCERFVLPSSPGPLRSLESNRPLSDFPLVLGSISFEHDYIHLISLLAAGSIPLLATDRQEEISAGSPLVIFGGVAVLMNPEPLAPFADLMVIGEAEPVLDKILAIISTLLAQSAGRKTILQTLAQTLPGCYAPSFYNVIYGPHGQVEQIEVVDSIPERVQKIVVNRMSTASHSQLASPKAELDLFMTELGRGCSRSCRFCAAAFIYRPPRLWDGEAIINALNQRPESMDRIGLLGMEMVADPILDRIIDYLRENSCSLSFSSLRADRISQPLLDLLTASRIKSVAIAPDGCSERLRRVINKNLTEDDLLKAAIQIITAGIVHLKLYVMIGLPTETEDDLAELVSFIGRLKRKIDPLGRARGRLTEITLSINSFVPKPWTPFQYCSYGGLNPEEACLKNTSRRAVAALKNKLKYLRKRLGSKANIRIKTDRPDRVLRQAVLSRGDRRLAPALIKAAIHGTVFKKALHETGLSSWEYAIRPRDREERFPWEIIDHRIQRKYLQREYEKATTERLTSPCNTDKCRSCGVCGDNSLLP